MFQQKLLGVVLCVSGMMFVGIGSWMLVARSFAATGVTHTQQDVDSANHLRETLREIVQAKKGNTELGLQWSTTSPPFPMFWFDPAGPVGRALQTRGFFAPSETILFKHILEQPCGEATRSGRPAPLVLDVGANQGYFTMFALAMGCRVIAFEANPLLRPVLLASAVLSGKSSKIRFYFNAASDSDHVMQFAVPPNDYGLSHVATAADVGLNSTLIFTVTPVKIDDVVDEDVLLMKIDTEGHEAAVVRSAQRLIGAGKVKNLVMEVKSAPEHKWKQQWLARMAELYTIRSYKEKYGPQPHPASHAYNVSKVPMAPVSPGSWPKWEDVWLSRSS